jgi:hypothetical protein
MEFRAFMMSQWTALLGGSPDNLVTFATPPFGHFGGNGVSQAECYRVRCA